MIRVGTAGWSYADWRGVVYPAKRGTGFDEVAYLVRYFDVLEINVTHYRPVSPSTVETWIARCAANPNFRFTAKLWQRFTHTRDASAEDERIVKDELRPLVEAGRFGALLAQFPASFHDTPASRDWIAQLAERFAEFPLVVEVRHASWARSDALAALRALGVGLCNIDQPLFDSSLGPGSHVTSDVGYVRLHGRNRKAWFNAEMRSPERYNYLYDPDELRPWAARIHEIADETAETYVIANNHYLGKAVVNALELSSLLREEPVAVPPDLLARYPQLESVANEESAAAATPQQLRLDGV